jgi:hypothetical protein
MDSLHATIEEFAAEGFTHIDLSNPHSPAFKLLIFRANIRRPAVVPSSVVDWSDSPDTMLH